jgi:hypothetical protein
MGSTKNDDDEYNTYLFNLIEVMISSSTIDGLKNSSFYKYFEITYNCLTIMLKESEQREEYEQCAMIMQILNKENKIFSDYLSTLAEEEKEDMEEEFENLKITMEIIKKTY